MHEMPAGFGAKNSYANGKRAEAGNAFERYFLRFLKILKSKMFFL
jgi:hypothetical protein